METTLETKIKDWYVSEYPHEVKNGNAMHPEITFGEFSKKVWANYNVYELIGVESETMRIRLFKELAFIRNIPYQHVDNEWIFSDL